MIIETKFKPNDLAWYKYEDKWYLCGILDTHILSWINVKGDICTEKYHLVYFKEITGVPPPPVTIKGERRGYVDDDELYENKGE